MKYVLIQIHSLFVELVIPGLQTQAALFWSGSWGSLGVHKTFWVFVGEGQAGIEFTVLLKLTGRWKLPCGHWEPSLGPLQEQSLADLNCLFRSNYPEFLILLPLPPKRWDEGWGLNPGHLTCRAGTHPQPSELAVKTLQFGAHTASLPSILADLSHPALPSTCHVVWGPVSLCLPWLWCQRWLMTKGKGHKERAT